MTQDFSFIPRVRTLVVTIVAVSLSTFVTPLSAAGDPVPPPDDNPFHAEDGEANEEPYVEDSDVDEQAPIPSEPLAVFGLPPDPGDLPKEWLNETPSETIEPATAKELTLTDEVKEFGENSAETLQRVPSPPRKYLPSRLDAAPGWQYSYSCDPNNKPGMVAFAELVSKHYNRPRYYTSRSCKTGNFSQHHEGRAVDWPMNVYNSRDKAIGDAVAYWLTKNNGEMARRFGVQSVIWNKRSWYLYNPGSWRNYTGPSPHTDHVHISFTWDGAMKRTSWWDGTPVRTRDYGTCRVYAGQYAPRYQGRNTSRCSRNLPKAPTSSYPVTLPRAKNSNVATAQRSLGFTGSSVDGSFGPKTLAALLKYQKARKLPWTGVLDKATWAYMERTLGGAPVTRISGDDRYETAASIAALSPRGADVYITTGETFPDALAAGARAGSREDPILLTRKNELPPSTIKQLKRIKPRKVYIVGGTGVVTSNVYRTLKSYAGSGGVQRLNGDDRYGTAAKVATQFGSRPSVVYVATGTNYPDALAGAARAGTNDAPILLTRPGSIPPATRSALRTVRPDRIVVLGSSNVVSDRVVRGLKGYASSGKVQRVSGSNRYETSSRLAKYYPRGVNVVYLTTGEDFPDAMAGAARAGTDSAPILLTRQSSLPTATKKALADLQPDRIVLLGGSNVVSTRLEKLVAGYVD